jgi:sRNA-binding protein
MYLKGMVAGAARVNLNGNPAGEVTARDEEYAAEVLALRQARRAAAVAAKDAERTAKQAATVAVAAPPAVKVVTLKKRPLLRLPAFRQQRATRATDASAREIPPRP